MELLDEIINLSKDMEVACKDLRANAFNIFPKLPTEEKYCKCGNKLEMQDESEDTCDFCK